MNEYIHQPCYASAARGRRGAVCAGRFFIRPRNGFLLAQICGKGLACLHPLKYLRDDNIICGAECLAKSKGFSLTPAVTQLQKEVRGIGGALELVRPENHWNVFPESHLAHLMSTATVPTQPDPVL